MKTFSRRRGSRQTSTVEASSELLNGFLSQDSDSISFLDSADDPFFFPEEPTEWEAAEQKESTAKQPTAGVRPASSSWKKECRRQAGRDSLGSRCWQRRSRAQ